METKQIKSVTNTAGFTTKTIGGHNYLIVPAVPIREQVLNTYYMPAKEIEFAQMWNGIPITIRHPVRNNGSVNVPEPDVAVIGKFYNGQWDSAGNRVTGEYWIDVDEAVRYVEGQYILNSIYNNNVLETSTGYWADEEQAAGEFHGRSYSTIHRNLRPDHIAILIDAIGACSVADGCGVNRNSLVQQLYVNECVEAVLNGGPGSGDHGHEGRPGEVGGSAPRTKRKPHEERAGKQGKELNKAVKAFYTVPGDKANKYRRGYSGRISLMSKAKAQSLFDSLTRGGFDPTLFEISLAKGTPYTALTSSSITVAGFPGTAIREISLEALKGKPSVSFRNSGCDKCPDLVMENDDGTGSLSEKIDNIRSSFYHTFMQPEETPYIKEVYDDHCLVELGDELFNAYFTTNDQGEVVFDEKDKWKKMELVETQDAPDTTDTSNTMDMQDNEALPASCYLVFADGTGHLPVKDASGKPNHRLMGAAWAALHGGYRGQKYKGPDKQEAINKLKALYAKEKMPIPSTNIKKGDGISNTSTGLSDQKPNKEKIMKKIGLNTLLEAIRGKGVDVQVNNEDEVAADLELELGDPAEEEEVPVTQNAQFTAEEADALKKLLALDLVKLNGLLEKMPSVIEMAQNAEAEKAGRKTELIGLILNSQSNVFSKEELEGFTLPVLTKMNSQLNVSYAGLAGGVVTNFADDEILGLPNVIVGKE